MVSKFAIEPSDGSTNLDGTKAQDIITNEAALMKDAVDYRVNII